jgi:nitrate/nitrite transporter NarK
VDRLTGSTALTRKVMATIGFTGASALLVVSTYLQTPLHAMLALGFASFSNDLVMPGAWGACMDVGGRYAGTLSGTMNMAGNLGGALCPVAIGYLLTWTNNNWDLTFYISAAIYFMGSIFWWLMDPVTPLDPRDRVAAA